MRIATLFVTALALVSTAALARTVSVTGGQIHGTMLEKGGAVFKGIPYAAPHIRELRWREPAPVKPWSGVRAATSFGRACAQLGPAASKMGGGIVL